jgi:hypothetical protein
LFEKLNEVLFGVVAAHSRLMAPAEIFACIAVDFLSHDLLTYKRNPQPSTLTILVQFSP